MIYIHIPFCKSRCLYCDFFSSTSSAFMNKFIDALLNEIDGRADEIRHACANTIYIGGGTPSQMNGAQIKQIFDAIKRIVPIEDGAEVTIECNPDDISEDFISGLLATPVNRISMGLQTLDDGLLCLLRRRHNAGQARDAVSMLHDAGYHNLSLDLMYGLPGQTIEMWHKDVDELLSMQVPHLSAYSLQWEEGTPLYKMLERGEVEEASEDMSLEMYRYLVDATNKTGMEHYEISNFARPGMRSKHNSGYWRNEPYVGLGPGAHSYDGGMRRSSNPSDLFVYIKSSGLPCQDVEILDDDAFYEEQVLKGLRTAEGLDVGMLAPRYRDYAFKMAQKHILSGRLERKGDVLRLTEAGIFVSNDVMSDMML